MKARSIARELALLGISQLPDTVDKVTATDRRDPLATKQLNALLTKALKTLSTDVQATLDTAVGELERSERLVLESETRTIEVDKVRSRIQPAIPLIQSAINHTGSTVDSLMFAQQAEKTEIITAKKALTAAAETLQIGDQLLSENEQRAADVGDARKQVQQANRSGSISHWPSQTGD